MENQNMEETKKCLRCGQYKSIYEFGNDPRLKSGRKASCKECYKKIWKCSKIKNAERVRQNRKEYHLKHRTEQNQRSKEYYRTNAEYIKKKKHSYFELHREEINEKAKIKRNNSIGVRIANWKQNAKRRGIDWLITKEDIEKLPMICFYTGTQLTLETNKFNTASLDRINNTIGYVNGNVVLCCWWVNQMKNDSELNMFLEQCEQIVKNKDIILSKVDLILETS